MRISSVLSLALCLLLLLPGPLPAGTYEISESELAGIENNISELRSEISGLRSSLALQVETSQRLRGRLSSSLQTLSESEQLIENLETSLLQELERSQTLRTRLETLQSELDELRAELTQLMESFEAYETEARRAVFRANARGFAVTATIFLIGLVLGSSLQRSR